jgi:predicted NBD/HSP70 family sugar kinase
MKRSARQSARRGPVAGRRESVGPDAGPAGSPPPGAPPLKILVIDIGGTNVKLLVSGESEARKFPSGRDLTPAGMVSLVKAVTRDWNYEAVSIGFPGVAGRTGPTCEPGNLGKGWVGYDFAAAFGCPVKIVNDAAMQALGSYDGGRMLFLGLGTGLGAALIVDRTIIPFELGELPWRRERETLGRTLSSRGLEKLGGRAWRKVVHIAATRLMKAFLVDYVVIGGGNAKRLKQLPHGLRLGHNQTAFRGGFRLWVVEDVPALSGDVHHESREPVDWRLL